MEYKVIYRKYRPNAFDGLVGQEYIKKTLKNTIISQKKSHAYIFSGPRGTGKTSTAKIFAKAINCLNPTDGNPCGKCLSCIDFESSPDVIEIDAASNNGVDEIRELINNIKLTPSYSKYKVYIIDEVHMLSTSAFNALLLTLEEPPSHVIFILATTDVQNIPITVLSRCQKYDFKLISTTDVTQSLLEVAKKEKIALSKEAAEEIAYISEGCLRDAYSALDQLTDGVNNNISLEDVVTTFGTVSNVVINKMIQALEENEIDKIVSIIEEIQSAGVNIKVFIEKLIFALKNYAIEIKKTNIIKNLNYQKIKNLILDLNNCVVNNRSAINLYYLIEIILLDYVDDKSVPGAKINENIKVNVSRETLTEPISKISTNPKKDFINIRVNNVFAEANKECLEVLKEKWVEFLKYIKEKQKKLFSLLAESEIVVASAKNAIILTNDCNAKLINDSIGKINKSFNEKFEMEYNFVSLDKDNWNLEKKSYIENKRNGVVYSLIDEMCIENLSNESEKIALDLFGDKLEIK